MCMQQGCNWHLGKIEFSVDLETSGKYPPLNIKFKSEVKVVLFDEKNKTPNSNNKKRPQNGISHKPTKIQIRLCCIHMTN